MLRLRSLLVVAFAGLASAATVACSSAPMESAEETSSTSAAIKTSDVIARAEQWVGAKLHYCQAPNGGRDYDSACSTYCNRLSNPQWDPYRSDCSGLVSWAWGLPAPGRVTGQFAPFVTDISHVIAAKDLTEGDAVNNNEHVMLFKAWTVPGKTATFIEEPGCSSSTPYAHEFTSNVTLNGNTLNVAWNGMTFTAIRYDKIQPADQPAKGTLDQAACEAVAGWAQDPDSPAAPVPVVLDFDAPTGQPNSGSLQVTASDPRADLCGPLGSCDHGFALPVPVGLRDGKAHSIFAYGLDLQGGAEALLAQAPMKFTCAAPAIPPGVRRLVASSAQKAWHIDPRLDVASEPASAVAALPVGADLEASPTVAIGDDGKPDVYVIDGGERRHVVDPKSLADWQLTAAKWPAVKLGALPQGADWPKARFALSASGTTQAYVMDTAPAVAPSGSGPGGSTAPAPAADAPAGDSGSAGCSAAGSSAPSGGAWLVVLGLMLACKHSRPRRSRPVA